MKNFFKALFGGSGDEPSRTLESPHDLMKGDFVRINDSFGIPVSLRGGSFQVSKISTYVYNYEDLTEFNIKGDNNQTVYMAIEDNDDDPYLSFAIKLNRKMQDEIFGPKAMELIYKNVEDTLTVKSTPPQMEGWLADSYKVKEKAAKGRYFGRDFRPNGSPQQGGEHFTYYELHSDDGKFAIEIEIWDEDEIDVVATLIRPVSDIKELWPSK